MSTSETLSLFAGNANPALAQDIAKHLQTPLGRAYVGRFSDGEVNIELMENVRGRDVFILQSTCPPANDSLMELLVMVDACRRASAARITAVVPYFGYSRQDRRPRATPPTSGDTTITFSYDCFHASPSSTGDAYTLSTGMSKNPWI